MWQIQVCFSQENVFLGASFLAPKSGDRCQIGPRSARLDSIVKSQSTYYPLVWVFCPRTSKNMINKVHERALRVIYLMTIKVILKHYCKIIVFLTTIEIFRHYWLKSSKLKKVLLPRSWDLPLKGEIILASLEIFKNLRQKEKELYILP